MLVTFGQSNFIYKTRFNTFSDSVIGGVDFTSVDDLIWQTVIGGVDFTRVDALIWQTVNLSRQRATVARLVPYNSSK